MPSDPELILELARAAASQMDLSAALRKLVESQDPATLLAFETALEEAKAALPPPDPEKLPDEIRLLIHDALRVMDEGGAPNGELDRLSEALLEFRNRVKAIADAPRSLIDLRAEARLLEKLPKTYLGIKELDELIGGLRPGWTAILGAFSGGGKTTAITFLGISLASRSHPVLLLTNELSEYEVTNRVDAALNTPDDLPTLKIWSPQGDIHRVIGGLYQWLKEWEGCERTPIILADYLQKFRPDQSEKSRERQVALIAETFQAFGRKNKSIMILAAQLNRESQMEEKPKLHHLRESGLIEQVADVAILLSKPADNQAGFEIAKHRWGKSGGETILSVDWARSQYGILTPIQRWGSLASQIREYLLETKKKSVKCRELQQKLSSHPKKDHVVEAAKATGFFQVLNSDVFLRVATDV